VRKPEIKFSEKRPTKPGWFWIENIPKGSADTLPQSAGLMVGGVIAEAVYVYREGPRLVFESRLSNLSVCQVKQFKGRFAGPIPVPQGM
jgi:hypothetical protein